ncbi:PucR family transcriptional regulator ligand-binding domain-containing protein [Ureibacillus chungkukjangi]|uniref:PucR family transcriptional regulator n=1 Tax=Ureibacillus chungkukjangi TaxID=1202712 RepID=UPI00204209A3|nr:PucR family transcriptional regulator [Ureibacillus chungkukjangi]MCM3389163.1 PucR family transcriptional regulator ligand-binding domain-containing protein [Ureibacillus chungkukjangi]
MNKTSLQINDILTNIHFKQAELVAGFNGAQNPIKWVHVLEVTNAQKLLKGQELILTTGVSFKQNSEIFLQFVQGLIETNCSGLCIEYGDYIQSIPTEILALANLHHFPIIVFHEEVRFVEITQDLHTLIINHQYSKMTQLENYSQLLNKEILTTQNAEQLLKILYNFLQIQIIFEVEGQVAIFYPNMTKKQRELLLEKKKCVATSSQFTIYPIYLFEHNYGEITLHSENREITEFEMLILDRTVTALAQVLLRNLYVEEKKGMEDAKWLEEWLEGGHSEEEVKQFILSEWPSFKQKESAVLVISLPRNEKNKQLDSTYFKLYCHATFDKKGFYPLAIQKKYSLILILLNRQDGIPMKERLRECIQKLETSDLLMGQEFAVGKFVTDLTKIHESYQTALDTLYISRNLDSSSCFYDELYVFHLIYKMQKHTNLEEMIRDYLQPLVDFEEKHGGELLETLEVYLQSNGSKQETAKRLFIVRQTLYHRLRRIESLIGKDFMNGQNRLVLEFMLLARKFTRKIK